MESEFASMFDAVQELILFDSIIQDCIMAGIIAKQPPLPTLCVDIQPAINFPKSPHKRKQEIKTYQC